MFNKFTKYYYIANFWNVGNCPIFWKFLQSKSQNVAKFDIFKQFFALDYTQNVHIFCILPVLHCRQTWIKFFYSKVVYLDYLMNVMHGQQNKIHTNKNFENYQ